MPVSERFSCKPDMVRTKAIARLIGSHAISPTPQRLSLEPIDDSAFFQSPRNDGHVLECGGVLPLLRETRASLGTPLDLDADPKAAEHRRTPKRKRNYLAPIASRTPL